jgi:hypothetical protein
MGLAVASAAALATTPSATARLIGVPAVIVKVALIRIV